MVKSRIKTILEPSLEQGWTLIEVTVILIIVGLLSMVSMSKVISSADQQTNIFYRKVVEALRYGQKVAMSTQCPVQFNITSSGANISFSLTQLNLPLTGASCGTGTQNVILPGTPSTAYTSSVPTNTGATLVMAMTSCSSPQYVSSTCAAVSTPTAFYFDYLGRPNDTTGKLASSLTLTVKSKTITINQETGFING